MLNSRQFDGLDKAEKKALNKFEGIFTQPTMMTDIVSRLDNTQIFCELDD